MVTLDCLVTPVSFSLAFVLRFDGPIPTEYRWTVLATLPALIGLRLMFLRVWHLFNGSWRHVGIVDLIALLKATTVSSALFVGYLVAFGYIPGFPRSIVLIEWGLALLFFGGMRFGVRWWREGRDRRSVETAGRRALIIGAGTAGALLLGRLLRDPDSDILPVGLVDDDPHKASLQLHGVPVVGTTREIEHLVRKQSADLLILAIATRTQRRSIAERCSSLNVEIKIVPNIWELIDGRAGIVELRKVEPQDLLERPQISLDLKRLETELAGQVVMVTGGAGSIGSELARQAAIFSPSRLVLVDQAESDLYMIDHELTALHPSLDLVPIVGDVTVAQAMESVFAIHRPDFVFHAAAYKHVPLMEANAVEAVRNNVFGTARMADCSARHGARRFVLISTDKAVRPSSIMGATKRVAERLVLETPYLRDGATDFRAVRFGNVLDSAGSVVPLFRQQIAQGGPVTVTHPEMTRYFMTIPEAVQLVMQASVHPDAAGRISILEMGEPVKILCMAENLIRLSGLEPYDDIPIMFTGVRAGEKLHEELMSSVEETVPTDVDRIRVVQRGAPVDAPAAVPLTRLAGGVRGRDTGEIMLALAELVPDVFHPLKARYRAAQAGRAQRLGHPRRLQPEDYGERRRTMRRSGGPGAGGDSPHVTTAGS